MVAKAIRVQTFGGTVREQNAKCPRKPTKHVILMISPNRCLVKRTFMIFFRLIFRNLKTRNPPHFANGRTREKRETLDFYSGTLNTLLHLLSIVAPKYKGSIKGRHGKIK